MTTPPPSPWKSTTTVTPVVPGHGPLAPAAGGGLTPRIVATARTAAATVRARQRRRPREPMRIAVSEAPGGDR